MPGSSWLSAERERRKANWPRQSDERSASAEPSKVRARVMVEFGTSSAVSGWVGVKV